MSRAHRRPATEQGLRASRLGASCGRTAQNETRIVSFPVEEKGSSSLWARGPSRLKVPGRRRAFTRNFPLPTHLPPRLLSGLLPAGPGDRGGDSLEGRPRHAGAPAWPRRGERASRSRHSVPTVGLAAGHRVLWHLQLGVWPRHWPQGVFVRVGGPGWLSLRPGRSLTPSPLPACRGVPRGWHGRPGVCSGGLPQPRVSRREPRSPHGATWQARGYGELRFAVAGVVASLQAGRGRLPAPPCAFRHLLSAPVPPPRPWLRRAWGRQLRLLLGLSGGWPVLGHRVRGVAQLSDSTVGQSACGAQGHRGAPASLPRALWPQGWELASLWARDPALLFGARARSCQSLHSPDALLGAGWAVLTSGSVGWVRRPISEAT